ncbi:hypothetical protein ACXN5S_03680 [Pseudoroseicyclus sp. H15]
MRRAGRKTLLLCPPLVFLALWAAVLALFELRLSTRLTAPTEAVLALLALICGGYLLGALYAGLAARKLRLGISGALCRRRRRLAAGLLWGLLALAAVEAAIEGFIPALALARGARISHFDFGIASIHGLLIAGLTAVGAVFFAEFCLTGRRRALAAALVPIAYAVLFVSRKMFTVCFLEYAVIFLCTRPLRLRGLVLAAAAMPSFIYAFGAFGDLRGRSGMLGDYGGFEGRLSFPGDTGFRWVYLYATTPLDNLSHTAARYPPETNLGLSRTLGPLVPSAVTRLVEGEAGALGRFQRAGVERYWLKSAMFNVSTGFNPAYLDLGRPGIFAFAAAIGFATTFAFCTFRGIIGLAVFAALMAGSVLTVFSNSFSNLNYAGQALFFLLIRYPLILRGPRHSGGSLPMGYVTPAPRWRWGAVLPRLNRPRRGRGYTPCGPHPAALPSPGWPRSARPAP